MSIMPYRLLISLSVFICFAQSRTLIIASDARSDNVSKESDGNRERIGAGFGVLASETTRSKNRGDGRDRRDVASTVALIRDDETSPNQSIATSSPTKDSKHRRRGRCRNRLGCVRFGTRVITVASSAKGHRPPQREALDRNLEKLFLVGNRSLELFRREVLVPAATVGDAIIDRSSKGIGDILADARSRRGQRITETLPPKILSNETAWEKNKAAANGPNRSLEDQSQTPVPDNTAAGGASKYRTERYRSLQYEFDSNEDRGNLDWSGDERKYEWRKTPDEPEGNGDGDSPEDDSTVLASMYLPIGDNTVIHESLAALLSRLFDTLENSSAMESSRGLLDDPNATRNWFESENSAEDLCQKWLDSKDKLEKAFLGPLVYLPACPCQYPSSVFYNDKIWDEHRRKYFRWRDANGESERIDVYKPGAAYCVRSLLSQGSGHAAAQHCCYDRQRRLLTRGSGAGTPNFVSPELSTELHERIDTLPWRLCRGDFSRFNGVRPPNNDNRCKTNPDDAEYRRQINNTKYY